MNEPLFIVTGKPWEVTCQRVQADGVTPEPFLAGETIRAALNDLPTNTRVPVAATITDMALATYTLTLTAAESVALNSPARFGIAGRMFLDVDVMRTDGEPEGMVVNEPIPVYTGVTG